MSGLTRLLLLIASVCLAPGVAAARDGEDVDCTPANSSRATIARIWSDEHRLRNRCVAVEGYRFGDVIFTDQRALYRYMARRSRAAPGIVGIPYPVQLDSDARGLMRGTYYGRVESCREAQSGYARTVRNLRRRPPTDDIILVHLYGFCASSAGPAVRVEQADERPSSELRRLTGDRLRASLGELSPIDERYRGRAVLPWLTDIATNGCAAGFEVQGPPPGGPPEGDGVSVVPPNLGPAQRDRLAHWCASATRQRALFAVADSSPNSNEAGTRLDVVLCLCLTEDCSGRWPVALIDTGWAIERPYFCQRAKLRPQIETTTVDGSRPEFSDYSYEFSDEFIVSGPWQDGGFLEP